MFYDACDQCNLKAKLTAVGDSWLCKSCFVERWQLFSGRDPVSGWLMHGPASRCNDLNSRVAGE